MRSAAEKMEWRTKMHRLAKQVSAMMPAEREAMAGRLGTVNVAGHTLSPYNTCLLWLQAGRPLLQVGGFKQWQAAGRIVRKGEHAAGCIYVPIGHKDDEGQTEEKTGFILVSVFDISQTEPKDQAA